MRVSLAVALSFALLGCSQEETNQISGDKTQSLSTEAPATLSFVKDKDVPVVEFTLTLTAAAGEAELVSFKSRTIVVISDPDSVVGPPYELLDPDNVLEDESSDFGSESDLTLAASGPNPQVIRFQFVCLKAGTASLSLEAAAGTDTDFVGTWTAPAQTVLVTCLDGADLWTPSGGDPVTEDSEGCLVVQPDAGGTVVSSVPLPNATTVTVDYTLNEGDFPPREEIIVFADPTALDQNTYVCGLSKTPNGWRVYLRGADGGQEDALLDPDPTDPDFEATLSCTADKTAETATVTATIGGVEAATLSRTALGAPAGSGLGLFIGSATACVQ